MYIDVYFRILHAYTIIYSIYLNIGFPIAEPFRVLVPVPVRAPLRGGYTCSIGITLREVEGRDQYKHRLLYHLHYSCVYLARASSIVTFRAHQSSRHANRGGGCRTSNRRSLTNASHRNRCSCDTSAWDLPGRRVCVAARVFSGVWENVMEGLNNRNHVLLTNVGIITIGGRRRGGGALQQTSFARVERGRAQKTERRQCLYTNKSY